MLLVAPSLVITACGYGLKETYKGVPYNSTEFTENYYKVWDSAINPYSGENKITDKRDVHVLNDADLPFTSLSDINFRHCDDNWESYAYNYDKYEPADGRKAYGPAVSMFNYDSSFKYGVKSKMFDGQMFCNGDYANARTQIEPINETAESGMGVLFSKECNDASYFMMNFKCSIVPLTRQDVQGNSNLKITVSFILKNDTGYTYVPVSTEVNEVPTNSGDSLESRDKKYVCLGFSLKELNISRLIGFTIQYEKISDDLSSTYAIEGEKIYHALMLYEVSFPYTTWH